MVSNAFIVDMPALFEANADAWLPDLAQSLNNLADRYRALGRSGEADAVWDAALTQARARRLLRARWSADPAHLESVWRATTADPPPPWLAIPAALLDAVDQWLATTTWRDSHTYLLEHPDLLAAETEQVLDELTLDRDPKIIDQHRAIIAAAREHGVDAAYQPLLRHELIGAWLAAPTWPDSRALLDAHPELLTDETASLLDQFAAERPTSAVLVHRALLDLIREDGSDTAYGYLGDRSTMDAGIQRALAERSAAALSALAVIEAVVHDQPLLATGHLLVAAVLGGETPSPPDEFAELVAQAEPADRNRLAAQIAQILPAVPDGVPTLAHLLQILVDAADSS